MITYKRPFIDLVLSVGVALSSILLVISLVGWDILSAVVLYCLGLGIEMFLFLFSWGLLDVTNEAGNLSRFQQILNGCKIAFWLILSVAACGFTYFFIKVDKKESGVEKEAHSNEMDFGAL